MLALRFALIVKEQENNFRGSLVCLWNVYAKGKLNANYSIYLGIGIIALIVFGIYKYFTK